MRVQILLSLLRFPLYRPVTTIINNKILRNIFCVVRMLFIIILIFYFFFLLQFDDPSEDLPEFVAEEEAGFKGE